MKRKLITACEKCGHLNFEKKTLWSISKRYIRPFCIVLLLITSIIGTLGLYNLFVGEVYENYDMMFTIGGAYATIENIMGNFRSSDELNEIALELTRGCSDDECKVKAVYDKLKSFRHEYGIEKDPLVVWNEQEGDCDELSLLAQGILRKVNINSIMQCNHNHCWLIVFTDDKKILVDIVQRRWEVK